MEIKYVRKGDTVLMNCPGGVARKPAPSDGYTINDNGTLVFITEEQLVRALSDATSEVSDAR